MQLLNEQQRQAVEAISGHSMIIAGPGSGKTFVIVEKILKLVNSGVPQDSILCVTFTEKAAGEMKQRLEGHGMRDVTVNTFHAFAKGLLEDNFVESDLGRQARIFKKTSQLVWCIKNTDGFGFDSNYLDIGNGKAQIQKYDLMLEAISSFKEAMRTSQELQEHIDLRIGSLLQKDAQDQDAKKQLKAYRQLNEFNKVYRAYEQHCKEMNLIDFDDMVTMAVSMLKKDPVILQDYCDRFRHIMVDEFQDNNYSQMQMISALGSKGNVTVVGDGDQSIMRFQGAHSAIFEDFEQAYPDLERFELSRNYRSTKNIVNLANQLLEPVGHRKQKTLYSEEEDGQKTCVIRCPTDADEVEFVVKKIRSLIGTPLKRRAGAAAGSDEPVSYRDIAILTRRKAEGHRFARSLGAFGIPAIFVGEFNMFASPAILDLISYLKIADSPSTAGAEIYRILKSHGISEHNIAVLTGIAHRKAMDKHDGANDFVLETVQDHGKYRITQRAEIAEIARQINEVVSQAPRSTVSSLVYDMIFRISGLYKRHIDSKKTQDKKTIMLLNKFYDIAQEFHDTYPDKTVSDFLADINIIRNLEVEIEGENTYDSVSILTMHKSKGKQFPIVFVSGLTDGMFPTKWKDTPFAVPAEMARGKDDSTDAGKEHIREERRLLYVSMTRAMNMLFLTYPKRRVQSKNDKPPSQFLEELDYENNPLITVDDFEKSGDFDVESEDEIEGAKTRLQREAIRAISQSHLASAVHRMVELARVMHYEKNGTFEGFVPENVLRVDTGDLESPQKFMDASRPLIDRETFTLSPSSIRAYQDCPLKFKYQKIMRVPQTTSAALDLGKVIHAVVEKMAKKKADGGKLAKEECMKILRDKWIFRSYQNKEDEDRAMKRAEQMVDAYLRWEAGTSNTLIDTEIPFEVEVGGVKFTGRIDRLERNPQGRLEVVDFKSGTSSKSNDKARVDPQLNIYAKAVESIKGELPVKASLFYLERDKMAEYHVTKDSVDEALAAIGQIVQSILEEDFEPTPSYQACKFCSYQSICDASISM